MTDANVNETNAASVRFVLADVKHAEQQGREATAVQSEQTPKRRRGLRLCRFFARGTCTEGDKCKFSHEKRPKKSKKRSGDEEAPGGLEADVNSGSVEAEPAQQPDSSKSTAAPKPKRRNTRARKCKFFARNKCRDGDKCKFSHDDVKGVNNDKPRRAVVVQFGVSNESAKTMMNEDSGEWSDSQQRALDMALKKYPASMEKGCGLILSA